jgi:hypothetical protein
MLEEHFASMFMVEELAQQGAGSSRHQAKRFLFFSYSPTLKMVAMFSYETHVNSYRTFSHNIPEDGSPHGHRTP